MRILITGGLGFQGSHLAARWLADGHDVHALATPTAHARANLIALGDSDVVPVWGSVSDFEIVDKAASHVDTIVHLAAWSSVDASLDEPGRSFYLNAMGGYHVLEAARRHGCSVVMASTCEVYGSVQSLDERQSETSVCVPASPYAAGKLAGDRLAIAYYHAFKLPVTVLRPCNVFGPRQKLGAHGAVIPTFVAQALRKTCLTVRGDGEQSREWIYIDDLVSAYDCVLRAHAQRGGAVMGEVFNIGTRQSVSVLDIATECAEKIGGYITYVEARDGDVQRFALDSAKFRSRFGWVPIVPFWFGFGLYVAWAENERGRQS